MLKYAFILVMAALIVAVATTVPCFAEISNERLVTWLTLDEGNGTAAHDMASDGLVRDDSELKGDATWTTDGVHGGAVHFSGNNGSYVYLHHCSKDIQAITTGGPHNRATFAFWFKCDDNDKTGAVQTLFETGGYHNNLNIFLYQGQLYVGVNSGYPSSIMGPQWLNTLDNLVEGTSFELQDNQWRHLAFVIEADEKPVDDGYRVYLDGQLIMKGRGVHLEGHGAQAGLGAVNDEAIYPSARQGWRPIPSNPHAPDADPKGRPESETRGIYPFVGCMDDFRLYKRVLSAEEIKQLHNEGREALRPAGEIATSMYRNNPAGTGELLGAPEFVSLEIAWVYPTPAFDSRYLGPIYGDGKVYFVEKQTVVALNAITGEQMWQAQSDAVSVTPRLQQYTGIGPVAATTPDKVLVPCDNGNLVALNSKDGSLVWTARLNGLITNPVVVDSTVYVTDDDGLAAVDCDDGRVLWRVDAGGQPEPFAMAVITDGHAYYGTQDGRIHKIDIARRENAATFDLGGREINGTFCYDKGFLYVGLHAPIRILKTDTETGERIQRDAGSGLTRSGMQVTGDYLLVFGVHNPGCVHASDLSRFFSIKRRALFPKGVGMTYDMQYTGATIVGKQILYLNACGREPSPVWVTRLTPNGFVPEIEVDPPADSPTFFQGYRAPTCYFPADSEIGWVFVGVSGGIVGLKGRVQT